MSQSETGLYANIRSFLLRFFNFVGVNWVEISMIFLCLNIGFWVLTIVKSNDSFNSQNTLNLLLTVNGLFSAILITYLITRVRWNKEQKVEVYNNAVRLSQKITEFRKICDKLTKYYTVWESDDATKMLLDHNRFKNLDYYDFRFHTVGVDYIAPDGDLIDELLNHNNYADGLTIPYLAMDSIVKNRKSEYRWQEELHKDFDSIGLYSLYTVNRGLECQVFGTIWYWMGESPNCIRFHNLSRDTRASILVSAAKINPKYANHDVNNILIRELSEDIDSHYLKELQKSLLNLNMGLQGLSLIILSLITCSLLFGVLAPFFLLLILQPNNCHTTWVQILASINVSFISYFILRFPVLLKKEIKWKI